MENKETKQKHVLVGKVISDKMDKTVVVKVDRSYEHPVFHKTMRREKNYKVHDENELAKVGDIIEFYEGRPVSKTKYMYLVRVMQTSAVNQ
jgi:small subunit ribosomal protein S17